MKQQIGTKFNTGLSDEFQLPRTEFLLRSVKHIEESLIKWYKEHKYSQGDDYSVRVTSKGKWVVSHSNDYPMQHGSGSEYILSEIEFQEAVKPYIIY
jgi:hypothetical protein